MTTEPPTLPVVDIDPRLLLHIHRNDMPFAAEAREADRIVAIAGGAVHSKVSTLERLLEDGGDKRQV